MKKAEACDIREEVHKYVDSTFKSGILKFIVLNALSKRSTYPYELYKRLRKVDFGMLRNVQKSEVYNVLNSLEAKGLVRSATHLIGAKVQKEYSATKEGRRVAVRSRKVMARNMMNVKRLIAYELE